jgi:hypothetical protein
MVLFIIHVAVMEEFWKLQYKVLQNDHWTSTVTTFAVNLCRCSLSEWRLSSPCPRSTYATTFCFSAQVHYGYKPSAFTEILDNKNRIHIIYNEIYILSRTTSLFLRKVTVLFELNVK